MTICYQIWQLSAPIKNTSNINQTNAGVWGLTQLCMEFAMIRDHVGRFESKRLKGGITLTFLGLAVSTEKDLCLLFDIYSSSYFDIWGLRSGVLDVADNHTNTQRNPDNPKITKGPNIPPCDMRMGESVSPIAHPSWNPAIEIPTALDRSVCGNHLKWRTKTSHYKYQAYFAPAIP